MNKLAHEDHTVVISCELGLKCVAVSRIVQKASSEFAQLQKAHSESLDAVKSLEQQRVSLSSKLSSASTC